MSNLLQIGDGGAILALDLGTTTGWAIQSVDGRITSGTLDFKPKRFEGGGMRYLRFRQALAEMNAAAGYFHRIAFEEVRRHAGVDAAHTYGGFLATLGAWAEHHNIAYAGIPVGTWKKALTGKGNASKSDVVTAVQALGFAPESEDEADALGVLLHALKGGVE